MAKKRPQQRQPKQPSKRAQREAAAAKATFADDDESISSASEDDELQQPPVTEEREETVEEARLRRARAYVAEQRAAASDSDEDDLNERLREQREARSQRAFTRIDLDDFDGEACARRAVVLKGHRGPVTSVCLCEARNWCFSGSKDNGLLQHDTETGQKVRTLLPRWPKPANAAVEEARSRRRGESSRSDDIAARQAREAEVLCVAASSDGRLLASGGSDRLIHVWDTRQGTLVHSLQGHGGDVLALAFRDALGFEDDEDDDEEDNDREQQLFSASADRNVKHWQAEAGSYVETLFGHSSAVSALDCGFDERPLSGGRDRCARVWKIRDETHLVFRAPHDAGLGGSVDAVRVIDRDRFVSGGDDGGLSLWSTRRKKPVVTIKRAHGSGAAVQKIGEDVPGPIPRWVSAVGSARRSDLVVSGSCDGVGRLWTVGARADAAQSLDARGAIPQLGFVNDLACPASGAFVAAAVGKEPRLGRWEKVSKAPNAVVLLPLSSGSS